MPYSLLLPAVAYSPTDGHARRSEVAVLGATVRSWLARPYSTTSTRTYPFVQQQ